LENLPSKEIILEYLEFPQIKLDWLLKKREIVLNELPIAIHIRRGDFLNLPEYYDVITRDYYLQALTSINEIHGKRPIHLFSDEPQGAIEFLGTKVRVEKIISQPKNLPTAAFLDYFSSYPFIIGANSTFSWWAGYLGSLRKTTLLATMPSRFLKQADLDPAPFLAYSGITVIPV
jgi:hypothetical protein